MVPAPRAPGPPAKRTGVLRAPTYASAPRLRGGTPRLVPPSLRARAIAPQRSPAPCRGSAQALAGPAPDPIPTAASPAQTGPGRIRIGTSKPGNLAISKTEEPHAPNVNQCTFTKSAACPLANVRYTVCTPVTLPMLAGTVFHVCHPPVFPTAKLPMGAAVGLSSDT